MRYLSKAACAIAIVAGAIAVTVPAADAQSRHAPYAFGGAYDASGSFDAPRRSVPYDAGGPAYGFGQRSLDSSSDFQLQGR